VLFPGLPDFSEVMKAKSSPKSPNFHFRQK